MHQHEDHRDHHQREQRGRDQPADHRCGDAAHGLGPRSRSPHDGQQTGDRGRDRHHDRPHAQGGALVHRGEEVVPGVQAALASEAGHGLVEEDEQQHAEFRGHAGQRDEPDADRDAQVVVEDPQQPHAAGQPERQGQHDDARVRQPAEVQVQQQEDDAERHGDRDLQPLRGARHVFVLPAPREAVTRGQGEFACQRRLRPGDPRADVHAVEIDVDPGVAAGVLALDRRRPLADGERGQLRQRHVRAGRGRHEHAAQHGQVVAQFARVPQVDRIALQPLDRERDVAAADRRLDDVLDVADGQAVAGDLVAVDLEVEIVAADHALGEHAERAGLVAQDGFDPLADLLQDGQVGPGDFDADRGLDPGREHVDARLDRHGPGVGHAGQADGRVEFGEQPRDRHAGPPLVGRLERDDGLDHRQRRRIGRSLGTADLAEHRIDFGHLADHPVGLLQDLARLGDG